MATLALGVMVSFGAVQGMRLAFFADEIDSSAGETPFLNKLTPNPEAFSAAQRAQGAAMRSAIAGMRWPRVAILFGLSSAAAMVFVSALRLRWPSGVRRLGVAQLLGRSAVVAAVLRTLDGAQELVIVRASVAAYEKELASRGVELANAGATMPIFSGASVVTTALVTGLFLVASNYFRSERILQTFELLDRELPEEE
ncbi:MAG: hypothetical protein MUC96_07910 [Myxococcaceae bacterium]|jgi:hypothetical protein|nr:hypothetical protein [Myxococcaceae bacterium]